MATESFDWSRPDTISSQRDDSLESGVLMQPGQDVAKKLERMGEVESAKRGPYRS